MKVGKITPKVITYKLVAERNDPECMSCMWARFIFDCDNGRININSDAGDYSYGWGHNDHEDFMSLISRINKYYLLDKIASRSVFDIKRSKISTIENIREFGIECLNIEDKQRIVEIIADIEDIDCVSEETFYWTIINIVPEIDYESIEIVKDYPQGAVVVSDLFEKYIQPKIREDISQSEDLA